MDEDSLAEVLHALTGGDADAAERAYRTYAPLLRMLVRRRLTPALRARFDSVDVVQSVWADVVEGLQAGRWQFDDVDQLRGFLVRATSNRLVDRARQHTSALKNERTRGEPPNVGRPPLRTADSPSALAQAEELWQQMLASCPPHHRAILALRRKGFTSAEIAARVGLDEGSVRRILGQLTERLAARAALGDD